ncbi:MAG: ABC transporter permease [Cyclobacteriaceae bacterium]
MLKNYFNVSFRNLTRHKFYSILNILGLTIGLACFMMISLFVIDELGYDKFFKDSERIFRVNFYGKLNGSEMASANVGFPTGPALKADYPEVEDVVRINETGNWFIREKDKMQTFKEENVIMVDSNFFQFFSVPLVYGNPKTCLQRPNTIVMDVSTSRRMFGEENPVGKTLVLDNQDDYEVTGVYEDLPNNSHFHHNIMLSMITFNRESRSDQWLSTNFNTYVRLREGTTKEQFDANFPQVIQKYCAPLISQYLGMDMEEFGKNGNAIGFELFPLEDIHLYSHSDDELEANGDIKYVYIFSAVALFILILACINFMNLATARSANRAKEVGVRKVMGAIKGQLVNQFISEAVLLSLISGALAFILVLLLLPQFGNLASKTLDITLLFDWQYLSIITAIVLLVGFLAGSYPAFYLSAFRPAEVLKGKVRQGMKSGPIRSALVVFQFSISIIMIIGTAVVFDQLSYIQNKKLGFDKERIIMVKDAWILRDKANTFKEEVKRNPNILQGSMTGFSPVGENGNSNLHFNGATPTTENSLVINQGWVDYDYKNLLGIQMADGRFFSKDYGSDSSACVINEAAAKAFGYETPVGDKLYSHGGQGEDGLPEIEGYKIIGVVKDFHFKSLRDKITPLIMRLGNSSNYAMFKIQGEDIKGTITAIESTWDEFAPGQPFSYTFLDQKFDQEYEAEQKVGEIFSVFAVLAIFIACLGLFGLAAFTAEQKTKEIGIRKALGASVTNIVTLLSRNFVKLVIISFVVSVPISYWGMKQWLDDFAYRTEIKPLTFIIAGLLAFVVAIATMSFQSWKAARVNPVKSLRDE